MQPQIAPETVQRGRILCSGEVNGGVWFCRLGSTHIKEKDKVERVNRRAAKMVSNDYGRHSSVTSMLTRLGWATLEQRRENQRLTMMYKVVHGLVAVPTTHLTAADSRTRANHSFKFRTIYISCNSTPYKYSFFPRTIPSWNLLPAETAEATSVDAFKHRLP